MRLPGGRRFDEGWRGCNEVGTAAHVLIGCQSELLRATHDIHVKRNPTD